MKYFLVSFLLCTIASAQTPEPKGGFNLGTIEMWTAWIPGDETIDLTQICPSVREYYNALNQPRGYWGRLLSPNPSHKVERQLADGRSEKRFYCRLRVKKFPLENTLGN